MTPTTIEIRVPLIEQTLSILRESGSRNSEGIALWLGRKTEDRTQVLEVYVPEHEAEYDYFHIPPRAMSALLSYLGRNEYFVAAQVHSHPKEAFHSDADDRWAIIRHEGALSLVIPNFGRGVYTGNILDLAALFRLDGRNVWMGVSTNKSKELIAITQ